MSDVSTNRRKVNRRQSYWSQQIYQTRESFRRLCDRIAHAERMERLRQFEASQRVFGSCRERGLA